MIKLNSLSHYNLTDTENGYAFTTDFGNEYLVTFSDLTNIIGLTGLRIYDFGIEIAKRNSFENDKSQHKLKNTIAYLLAKLFSKQPDCALLIVLDSSDGKQHARYRMFLSAKHDSWFSHFNNGDLEIVNLPLKAEEIQDTCFLLLRRSNPRLKDIQTATAYYLNLSFDENDT